MPETEAAAPRSSNVELIERLLSLSNRCAVRDSAALTELLAIYDQNAQIKPLRDATERYDGSAEVAIRSYFERIAGQCFVWFIYADQLQEHGDRVLALGGIRTVDRETREDHETALALMYTVQDGKVAAVEAFSSFVDARAALRAQ
jgi:hypothetical protein